MATPDAPDTPDGLFTPEQLSWPVSSRLLISALEKTSLPLPRSHRQTARDTGGLRLPHLLYVRRTLTTIIVLIEVADSGIATVLHLEFLRKNARDIFRLLQAATTVVSRGPDVPERSLSPNPPPPLEGLAPQTIGCYRLGFVVLCTD